tara:strand:+ start:801 stop:1061 length:261 start_codon:yes stop_codon:yes gene_type:complete
MNINELIAIVKKKIKSEIATQKIIVQDKSYLHKNHPGNQKDKFHLKIFIESDELKKISKIEANKKIYKTLSNEMSNFIHSIQILIN